MQYKCNECNDTGSRDKSGDYLDCGHCDAAMQRKSMNDFLDKLPAMGDYDAAWLVHQQALAMAPKQEAPQPAPEIRTVLRDSLASGLTMAYGCSRVWSAWGVGTMSEDDFYPASECDELLDELCDLAIAALRPDLAAPAAANGALTEDEGEALTDLKNAVLIGGVSDEWLLGFIRQTPLAAAGPDAALVGLIHKAQTILAHHLPPDGPDAKTTISALLGLLDGPESRAALSGVKGN